MKKTFRVRQSYSAIQVCLTIIAMMLTEVMQASQPTLSRVYSNRFTPQVQQYNNAGFLGTLNQEYGTNGNLNLTGTQAFAGYTTKEIVTLADGSMYVLLDNGSSSVVAMYNAIGILQNGFNGNGYVALPNYTGVNFINLDGQGRILVGGGQASTPDGWLIRIDPAANNPSAYQIFAGTWNFIGAFAQQTTGRYIVAGLSAPYQAEQQSIPAYTQIAGYKEDGTIDSSFGRNGYLIFDGSIYNGSNGFLSSTLGLLNVVIDSNNNIYACYVDATTGQANLVQFDSNGSLTGFSPNILTLGENQQILDNQICINLDALQPQNIIVAGTVAGAVSTIVLAGYGTSNFNNVLFSGAAVASQHALQITDLIALNNERFAIVSNDVTHNMMRVDQFLASPFGYDTNFNAAQTPGFIEFQIQSANSSVCGAAVGPDGQLYLATVQITEGATPYISKLYDYQYVTQVPQYPLTKLQGNFDVTFGAPSSPQGTVRAQQCPGVDFLYNGSFGQALNQQTVGIVELVGGNLLVGAYGSVQGSLYSNMMLNWLYPDGTFNNQVTLQNDSNSNEEMTSFAVAGSGSIYVAGTAAASGDHAFLRSYSSYGSEQWVSSPQEATDSRAAGIAIEGTDGILLFVQDANEGSQTGHISRYTSNGVLDTTFGPSIEGSQAGMIATTDYGLNMGPVWGGGLVRAEDNAIFIAYISTTDNHYINVAGILRDGSGLLPGFGDGGIVSNVFGFEGSVDWGSFNLAMAFDNQNNIIVGFSTYDTGNFLVTRLNSTTGAMDPKFNNGAVLSIALPNDANCLYISNIIGMSNGKFMLSGANYSNNNALMVALRVTDEGVVDTTFNPQGETPGILQFQITDEENVNFADRELTGLIIQSGSNNLGNVVFSTYEVMQSNPTLSIPQASRVYGQPRTTQVQRFPTQDQYPGILDTSLNNSGGFNLTNFLGDFNNAVGKVIYSYPAESAYDGMLLVGMDVDNTVKIVRFNQSSLTLDPTFGNNGLYIVEGTLGINNIIVDKHERIVACGTMQVSQTVTRGWAFYCDSDGQDAATFFNVPSNIIAANVIYQQQSGRFVIAGASQTGTNPAVGTLIAFQDRLVRGATTLAIDTTFNILTQGGAPQGQCNIATTPALYNLVINGDDTMYIAYQDSSNLQGVNTNQFGVSIAQLLADGSGLDQSWINGAVQTTLIPDNAQVISCVTDTTQNVIVAISANNTLQLLRYNSVGTPLPFTPTQGSVPSLTASYLGASNVLIIPSPLMGTAGVALTDMLGTNTLLNNAINGIILLGTNTANGNLTNYGNLFAVRLVDSGDLDATWNPHSGYPISSPNVPGVVTFGEAFGDATTSVITPAVLQWNGAIDISGNLLTVGASNNGYNNYPTLIELVGYPYMQAIPQTQIAGDSGVQDGTVWDNTNDAATSLLNLNDLIGDAIVSNLLINQITGALLIGGTNGSNGVSFTTVNAPLHSSSNINFNPAGSGTAVINDMFVADGYAQNNAILSIGTINNAMWAAVNSIVLPAVENWTNGNAIGQAVNGDTLAAGFNGTNGAIVAFLPNNFQIDPLFGNATPTNGMYTTDSQYPISAMIIDNSSRIYIGYKTGEQSGTLARVLANGSGLDPLFTSVSFANCDPSQIALALDQLNNQIVVASYLSGNINIYRYSTVDGSATGSSIINVIDNSLQLLDVSINTDQQIYCVATTNEGTNTVVARLNSTNATSIALDLGYAIEGGTPGIANVNVGMQTSAGALDPDRRIYVIGNNGENAYLARLFGNNYYLSVPQSNEGVVLGDLDYSYGYDGATQPVAGGASSGQIASTILPISTGSNILVTILDTDNNSDDGLGTWTVRLLPDGSSDQTYGDGQGVLVSALPGFEFTRTMIFDGVSNAISCGFNIGDTNNPIAFIKNVLPTGAMNPAFGGQNGNPVGTVYFPELSTIRAVAQLSNGNYVFVGTNNTNSNGMLGMMDMAGNLITGFGTNGFVIIGVGLSSVVVDAQNNMYVAGVDSNSNAFVAKLNAAGKYVKSFGSNGIASNVLTNLNSIELFLFMEMVLDAAGNLVVAGSSSQEPTLIINIVRLTPAGTIDTTFASSTSNAVTISFGSSACFPTSLVALTNNNYLVAGFQFVEDFADSSAFIAAITSNGVLDTNFNPLSPMPGIGLYDNIVIGHRDATQALNISVQNNGQILLAGCDELENSPYFIPVTMRINGYPHTQAVAQFPPLAVVTPNGLNTQFGDAGLCVTGTIGNLINGGSNAVDSQGRILIGGITSENQLVVARFTQLGVLDTVFNGNGFNAVLVSSLHTSGNSYIALDRNDNVYVAGYTASNTFVVTRFLASDGSLDNSFGSDGIAQSNAVNNLNYGGYVAIDNLGNVLVTGTTTDFKLIAARFTSEGVIDSGFGAAGIAATNTVSTLRNGAFVAADATDSVYVGACTTANQLMIAKFNNEGLLDTTFNFTGIAMTSTIPGFIDGGSIALDSNLNIVLGGYTSNKQFVAARFTPAGNLDSAFNGGIAYSSPLHSLTGCASICIDSNNNVLLGGTSVAADNSATSIVVARITPLGLIDTTFAATGVATSGTIYGLALDSGFIAVNQLGNPIAGGFDSVTPQLVIGEFYSGAEIFVNHPGKLAAAPYKIYWYGNNPAIFQDFFGIATLAAVAIADGAVQTAVVAAVDNSLQSYAGYVASGPNQGVILAASTTPIWDGNFSKLLAALILDYPGSSDDIAEFFVLFNARRLAVHNSMVSGNNQL